MTRMTQYLSFLFRPKKLFVLNLNGSLSCQSADKVLDCQLRFMEGKSLYCVWMNPATNAQALVGPYLLNISYGTLDLSFPCQLLEQWENKRADSRPSTSLKGIKIMLGPFSPFHHWQLLQFRWKLAKRSVNESPTVDLDQAA